MNKIFLIGNLTRDPELTETPSGVAVCHFQLAVRRNYTSGEEQQTDFFNCVAWRGMAETCAKYLSKGKKVAIVGTVQTRTYVDNNDIKRSVIDIVIQEVDFLSPKEQTGTVDDSVDRVPQKRFTNDVARRNKPTLQAMDDDEDIPF